MLTHQKEYNKNNMERIRAYKKKWQKENRDKQNGYTEKHRLSSPKRFERHRTRNITRWYEGKKVPKREVCMKCGTKNDLEYHHKDYSKPFEVDVLCKKCHGEEHVQNNR